MVRPGSSTLRILAAPAWQCANTFAPVRAAPIVLTPPNAVLRRDSDHPGEPPSAASTCRQEVVAAFFRLAGRSRTDVFTDGQVYAKMVSQGTKYSKSAVLKTMQRMKETPSRSPYVQLERVGATGFRPKRSSARSPY